MGGGSGSSWYKKFAFDWKILLAYIASPVVLLIGIITVLLPTLMLVVLLVVGGVIAARARPSK